MHTHGNTDGRIVVVGAGQIGTPLVARLAATGRPVTWVSRTVPKHVPAGVTHRAVDASDADALAPLFTEARAVIAAVNPATYDAGVWARTLPPLHRGLIDAAARAGVRLVVLDALYLYRVDAADGPLSPRTPQLPSTEKGKVRKRTADMLVAAQRAGLRATTLRASDFWGPELGHAIITSEGLLKLARGASPLLVGDADAEHAFSHRDDVVDALITLALADDSVEGRVYHAPVSHFSPRALVNAVSAALGVRAKPFVAPRFLLRFVGLFSKDVNGLVEMLHQWEEPYRVDDSDYRAQFGGAAVTLEAGAAELAALARSRGALAHATALG